jgi:hypothetical protein
MNAVMNETKKYMGNSPYFKGNLYMTAVLAMFRGSKLPKGPLYWAMLEIIELLTAELVTAVDSRLYPGQTPMICSQFVFQCFQDAGPTYELDIPDLIPGMSTILNQIIKNVENKPESYSDKDGKLRAILRNIKKKLRRSGLRSLEKAISSSTAGEQFFPTATPVLGDSAVTTTSVQLDRAVIQFAKAFHAARSGEKMYAVTALDALSYLNNNEAIFVTPGDLKNNVANLEPVDKIIG